MPYCMKPYLAAAIVLAALSSGAHAQPAAPLPTIYAGPSAPPALAPRQLDPLVAPIALYPDQLLADILAAATFPAQIVEAARFRADPAYADLTGTDLARAAAAHAWDPSVQSLLSFPPVLRMLDTNLEWTDRLGRAFAAQPADVMDAVQRLRHQAQQAGVLQNSPEETVVNDGDIITISPPSPQDVYVPTYDAACVYGPAATCDAASDALTYDGDILLPYDVVPWGVLDWTNHRVGRFARHYAPQPNDAWRPGANAPVSHGVAPVHAAVRPVTVRAPIFRPAAARHR